MDIYWIKNKQRCGPSTVPDVISLLQIGELTADTLGWHAGCKQWLPLRELPALADFLNKEKNNEEEPDTAPEAPLPTPPPDDSTDTQTESPTSTAADEAPQHDAPTHRVYLPSPTARLLARFVDCALYSVLYGACISLRDVPYEASLLLSINPLLWLPMLVLEAWMLSTWGTTPGKALMGIRITTFGDVTRLSFMRALVRALMVFTLGLGLMIPQLLPLMLLFEYWMLRRRGITPWDARNSTLPTQHSPASPSRYVLAVVLLYVSTALFFSCMKPWLPGMIDDIARDNPDMARALHELMPTDQPRQTAPTPTPPTTEATPTVPASPNSSLPGM